MGPACQVRVKEKEKGQGGVYGLKEVGPAQRPNISAWLSLVRDSVTWAGLRERLAGRLDYGLAGRLGGPGRGPLLLLFLFSSFLLLFLADELVPHGGASSSL